jgi:mitochondrial inner membrane protein COX18
MLKITISEALILQRCALHSSVLARKSNCTSQALNYQQKRNFTQNFWLTLSSSKPVGFLQDTLIQFHDTTGMPWWSTIVVSTVLLRGLITFPLALYQGKILAKFERISTKEMPKLVGELKIETAIAKQQHDWTDQYAKFRFNRSLNYHWKELIAKHNCHPMKGSIVILFQLPVIFFYFD